MLLQSRLHPKRQQLPMVMRSSLSVSNGVLS